MKDLTTRQRKLLDFIIKYQTEKSVIPSLPTMAQELHVSISRIQHIISALTRKKFLVRKNIYEILSADSCAILNGGVNEKTSDESADLTHIN
jgi:SOS-response transcriptional repressor LexA